MRLIDADRLLSDRMKKMYYHLSNGDTAIPLIDIEHAPTVEERKTMQWEHCENDQDKWFVCPVCQWQTYEATNYCPNCGSKREDDR